MRSYRPYGSLAVPRAQGRGRSDPVGTLLIGGKRRSSCTFRLHRDRGLITGLARLHGNSVATQASCGCEAVLQMGMSELVGRSYAAEDVPAVGVLKKCHQAHWSTPFNGYLS